MNTLQCRIISPQKMIVHKNLNKIQIPTPKGIMGIFPFHAETFVLVKKGNIILTNKNDKKRIIKITSGECYIKNNNVTIII